MNAKNEATGLFLNINFTAPITIVAKKLNSMISKGKKITKKQSCKNVDIGKRFDFKSGNNLTFLKLENHFFHTHPGAIKLKIPISVQKKITYRIKIKFKIENLIS